MYAYIIDKKSEHFAIRMLDKK